MRGDLAEVEVGLDIEPRVVVEPANSPTPWTPIRSRADYDRLAYGLKLQQVRAIESAKKPKTRTRRIDKAVATVRDRGSAGNGATSGTKRSPRVGHGR
jgi:hypothetical protein